MDQCQEVIHSDDYFDFILEEGSRYGVAPSVESCRIDISNVYASIYVKKQGLPPLTIDTYSYTAIPNCYTTQSTSALEASGILKVQNIPTLALSGAGVMVGIVDSGIDYQNPLFRYSNGSSRIAAIWDQTQLEGTPPQLFPYGAEYEREQINQALNSENPFELVPETDLDGHGTYLTSVAAGNANIMQNFSGAAPQADIAVVKLKRAKPYLYEFWQINSQTTCYQENDIMAAVAYLKDLAQKREQPLALCVALGSNMGNRGGDGPLSQYLNDVAATRHITVVTAAGNEGTARHHFSGNARTEESDNRLEPNKQVEISVGAGVKGFTAEMWAAAPELYTIEIVSPTGEKIPRSRQGTGGEHTFLFERTRVSISYRIVGTRAARQLIFLRFVNPTEGIWNLVVHPERVFEGRYHIYLPQRKQMTGEVQFIDPDPNETITLPGLSALPMTVSGYDDKKNGVYIQSSRGFADAGLIKPDFAAPAVDVSGAGMKNQIVTESGTSVAAAITTGAAALFLEWAVVQKNRENINSVDVKNEFLRGASQSENIVYPNRSVGYGTLNLYEVFQQLRKQ
ncbi:MAG: S8 family peptidase [Lachnospiraceae bacterium]